MRAIKPPSLRKGDLIGVVAPAGPVRSWSKLEKGIRYLEKLGYRVVTGRHIDDKLGYLAGRDIDRTADLHAMFADRRVKAIFAARGGYGIHRILPLLDFSLIKKNPKIVVGYSDITALHLALYARTGLITFAGPMVSSGLTDLSGKVEERFWQYLTSAKPPEPIQLRLHHPRLRNKAEASGRLLGGNLSVLGALTGTPFLPSFRNSILFLEEIDEAPYRIDRMLQQLRLAGILSGLSAVLIGEFTGCVPADKRTPTLSIGEVFEDIFQSDRYPVVGGLRHGHLEGSVPLPVGVRCRLDPSARTLEFLGSAVQ